MGNSRGHPVIAGVRAPADYTTTLLPRSHGVEMPSVSDPAPLQVLGPGWTKRGVPKWDSAVGRARAAGGPKGSTKRACPISGQ